MSDIEKTKPIDVLAARVWSGTKWHYPNIEKLIERIATLERELAEAKEQARTHIAYYNASSSTLSSLESKLTAANATIAACKADNDRLTDALKWLASGYTGVSCETLLFATFGIQSERNSHPYDHGDRSRCVALIRLLPWTLEGLRKLEREDKGWAAQVPLILDELNKPTPAAAKEAQAQ